MKKSKWLLPLMIAAFVALAVPRSAAANGLALTNATVIDVRTGRLLPDETVVIVGDRITALSRHAHIPADAKIVDATPKAKELGVRIGMTGREAVEALLKASSNDH